MEIRLNILLSKFRIHWFAHLKEKKKRDSNNRKAISAL